ncbi:MAG: GGDEF domain-containing protein [Alsobacter sp.]
MLAATQRTLRCRNGRLWRPTPGSPSSRALPIWTSSPACSTGADSCTDSCASPAGDAVLRHVVRVLAAHIRASDVFARLSGDELALLLWHATGPIADAKMAALQALLAESPAQWRSAKVPVRFSFGTVAVAPGAETAGLMEQANARLYATKAARFRLIRP